MHQESTFDCNLCDPRCSRPLKAREAPLNDGLPLTPEDLTVESCKAQRCSILLLPGGVRRLTRRDMIGDEDQDSPIAFESMEPMHAF